MTKELSKKEALAAQKAKRNATKSAFDLIGPSVELIKKHIVPLTYLVILPALVTALGAIMSGPASTSSELTDLTLSTSNAIGLVILGVGLVWSVVNIGPSMLLELRAIDGKQDSVRDLYKKGLRLTLPLIGLLIVFGLIFMAGLLLFIVPGLIFLRRYFLSPYYLIDKKLSIGQALSQSAKDSKVYAGPIWGVIGVYVLFQLGASIMGTLPVIGVILGELVTLLVLFISALRYREIQPATAK